MSLLETSLVDWNQVICLDRETPARQSYFTHFRSKTSSCRLLAALAQVHSLLVQVAGSSTTKKKLATSSNNQVQKNLQTMSQL